MDTALNRATPAEPDRAAYEQIDLLIQRGMTIPDDERGDAALRLSHIGHTRLREYWHPFIVGSNAGDGGRFRPGTTLTDVIELYIFDHKLRLLVFDAISHVEVSIRSHWASHLAQASDGGPQAYMNPKLFNDQYADSLAGTISAYQRNAKKKAKPLDTLSISELAEYLSIGQISRWFQNIKAPGIRQEIANHYGLDEKTLTPLLHHLTYVRNICAHHSRLWNLSLTVKMELPRNKPQSIAPAFNSRRRNLIYNTLVMAAYLLDVIHPGYAWPNRLLALLDEFGSVDASRMGFPADWRSRPFWPAAPPLSPSPSP